MADRLKNDFDDRVNMKAMLLIKDEVDKKCSEYKKELKLEYENNIACIKSEVDAQKAKEIEEYNMTLVNLANVFKKTWDILKSKKLVYIIHSFQSDSTGKKT